MMERLKWPEAGRSGGSREGLVTEFFEALIAFVVGDEGGDPGGEFGAVAKGGAVDDWLLEGALETLAAPVGSSETGFAGERLSRLL